MEAKDLVASGARWKVGTGECINILGQSWLLDTEKPCIETSSPVLENNKVSSLMVETQNHYSWDDDILSDLFTA